MGITGLIPFCKEAISDISLFSLRNKNVTVAVDSYSWLHKGAYCCSDKLVKGVKTTAHIDYCMKFVNLLLQMNIRPIMVFDGKNLPAKELTEKRRREDRTNAKEKAKELIRAGKIQEARKEFAKGVDITHEHAVELMKECQNIGVDCIVAMYEADSQLAYLNKIGIADYVISEDSDLILFGVKKILFKLQIDGRCQLFESSKLHLTLGLSEEKFDFEKFRRICILSGCDYLDSLPGIGLGKAKKFMLMTAEDNMKRALMKIPSYLNMRKLTVTDEYIEGFLKAEATFKFMYVFDPLRREMLRLNELDETDEQYCCNAGELIDQKVAFQIALGNKNPRTLKICNNFDPDVIKPENMKNVAKSIWKNLNETSTYKSHISQKQMRLSSFFSNNPKFQQVQNIAQTENEVETSIEVQELVSNYYNNYSITEPLTCTKRRKSEVEDEDEGEEEILGNSSMNPFAKRQKDNTNSLKKSGKLVKSKYFSIKHSIAVKDDAEDNTIDNTTIIDSEEIRKVEETREENEKVRNNYYDRLSKFIHSYEKENKTSENRMNSQEKCKNDEESEVNSQENEMEISSESLVESIDVDSYQFTKKSFLKTSSKSTSQIKPKRTISSLSKKKSSQNSTGNNSSQTLLSRFGFEKRTSVNS